MRQDDQCLHVWIVFMKPWLYSGVHLFIRNKSMATNVFLQSSKNPPSSIICCWSFLMATSIVAMTKRLMTRWACPGQLLSVNDTRPSRYRILPTNTHTRDILYSPYTPDIRAWISLPFTPSAVKKRTTARCSSCPVSIVMWDTHTTPWPHFELVYQTNDRAMNVHAVPNWFPIEGASMYQTTCAANFRDMLVI